MVNKLILEGCIYTWLILFQEFYFEVIVNSRRKNMGQNHLLRIDTREYGRSLNDQLPNAKLFKVEVVPNYLEYIIFFVMT